MTKPEYSLVGVDGNAFAIIGYTSNAMRRNGYSREEIQAYQKDATSGEYYHVIGASQAILDKINGEDDE